MLERQSEAQKTQTTA